MSFEMDKTVVILLTGGIGSGKSAVRRILEGMGVPCYDADSAVKGFYEVPSERTATASGAESEPEHLGSEGARKPFLLPEIEAALGQSFRRGDGGFDSRALAAVIFSDAAGLKTVENIVFPALAADFGRWRKMIKPVPKSVSASANASLTCVYSDNTPQVPSKIVVFESATALDKPDFPKVWDKCIWVDAPEELRIERVMARDRCTRKQVLSRLRLQSSPEAHRSEIDAVILNDCSLPELSSRVRAALNYVIQDAESKGDAEKDGVQGGRRG